ncbi:MAG TPA: 1,4-dihydroxy-2-naphthoate polyprenyltransferase [Victivallales bacterium]|nr:1,4-dihydroxy-2-naphthoate polyprenyltransferase [Victivallales bacterium]
MTRNINIWFLACRPKTLSASLAPVLIGTIMAYETGSIHIFISIITFLSALGIQIGTNLANDYFDFKNGADTKKRLGPVRVTQSGLIPSIKVQKAFILVFLIAILLGIILLIRGGWPILVIGVFAIALGLLYTGGPYPYGYHGLGDIIVLIFFGPVAVGGTYYLQTLSINFTVILAGFAPGLISMAILTVNNLRDIKSDAAAGKNTIAVLLGENFARKEYLWAIVIACLIPIFIIPFNPHHLFSLIAVLTILPAYPLLIKIINDPVDKRLNNVLAKTSLLLVVYTVLFVIGWSV